MVKGLGIRGQGSECRIQGPHSARASHKAGELAPSAFRCMQQLEFTQCIYRLVFESQLPHKIANIVFTVTDSGIKSTVLWGR